MSTAEQRLEKKRMDEAVERVREVVHTASKNDIILALHNFDMDVARTIQAFCEDGAQTALDSWQQSSTSSKKKNQQKRKTSQNASGDLPVVPPNTPATVSKAPFTNGTVLKTTSPSSSSKSTPPTRIQPKTVAKSQERANGFHAPLENFEQMDAAGKKKALAHEIAQLDRHGDEVAQAGADLETELRIGETAVTAAFAELRRQLDERERHLLAELARAGNDGRRVLRERRTRAQELSQRAQRLNAMSEREQFDLRSDIRAFVAERRYEQDIGRATRLVYDSESLTHLIKNFGEVIPVKPFSSLKNSSHSSLVSSVGEDSGLGQISPVAPEEKKTVVQVATGGIFMHSDAFTADQLEDLNRRLHESLKAQGIDPSVVSGIGGTAAMRQRRRAPPSGRGGGVARGGGRGGRGVPAPPQLSILQP